jgi:DNA-binding NtrC family response regulator
VSGNGKFRILVVDDEASVLTTYRMILELQGYDVVACRTWREAVAAIENENQDFDGVLCDYSLEQHHTGVEVIAAARRRDSAMPAALITGYANQATANEAAGENIAIMFKPIEIEEFLETTARLVSRCSVGERDNDGQEDTASQDPVMDEDEFGPDERGSRNR